MKCAICGVEGGSAKQELWGPEFAHSTCVIAFKQGQIDSLTTGLEACDEIVESLRQQLAEAEDFCKDEMTRSAERNAKLRQQLAVSEQARMEADELVLKQNVQLAELEQQNKELKEALLRWRSQAFPGTDQRIVIERDFPTVVRPE